MPSEFLADELISAVREEGLLPRSDEESTTRKIRAILNREQRLYLHALLQKAREEYQNDSATLTLVAGTTRYALPTRAAGAAIKAVHRVESTGNVPLRPVSQVQLASLGGSAYGVGEYYLDGNYLVLLETPSAAGSLLVSYPRRFNRIVAAEDCVQVSAFNTVTRVVTCTNPLTGAATLPTAFASSATFDVIRGTPHFDVLAKDEGCDSITDNLLDFTDALPDGLAVGDFIALAGQTPVCNAPLELQDVLVLKACHSYVSAGADAAKGAALKERWQQAEADALVLIAPRVKDSNEYIINYHGPGWNRGLGRFRRWQGS